MALAVKSEFFDGIVSQTVSFKDSSEKIRELKYYNDEIIVILSSKNNVYLFFICKESKNYHISAYNISQIYIQHDFLFCLSLSGALYSTDLNRTSSYSSFKTLKISINIIRATCLAKISRGKYFFSKLADKDGECLLLNHDKKIYTLARHRDRKWNYKYRIEMYKNRYNWYGRPEVGEAFFKIDINRESSKKAQTLSCRDTKIKLNIDGIVSISGEDFYGLKIQDKWASQDFIELPLVQLLKYSVVPIRVCSDDIYKANYIKITNSYFYIEIEVIRKSGIISIHHISWKIYDTLGIKPCKIDKKVNIGVRNFVERRGIIYKVVGAEEVSITVSKIKPSTSKTGVEIIEGLFNNELKSDIKFIIQGKEIFCHKNILSGASKIFEKMFSEHGFLESKSKSIGIEVESYPVYKAFLRFIYTSKFENIENLNIFEILNLVSLAKFHDFQVLLNICFDEIKILLTEENMVKVLVKADEKLLIQVRHIVAHFIKVHSIE